MFLKFLKLVLLIFISYQTPLYSKSATFNDFNSRDLSNYFSGIVAFGNDDNSKALKYFNFSKILINTIESKFIFADKPINRFNILETNKGNLQINKEELLKNLKDQINSIENCKLKENSNKIILGEGNINSPLMLVGESPGVEEEKLGVPFRGEVGELLNKMLLAINIKRQNIYTSYAINFRPPDDRKPTSTEIKRYSVFLKPTFF